MEQANPLDTLFDRAKRHGIAMAAICRRADIDPTTPSRWKRGKNGAQLEKVTQLTSALNELIAETPTPTPEGIAA